MRTWLLHDDDAERNSLAAALRVDGEHETGGGDTDENGGPGWNTAATPLDETTADLVRGVVHARAKERPDNGYTRTRIFGVHDDFTVTV